MDDRSYVALKAKIEAHIRRKLLLLNLQLGATIAVGLLVVLFAGWTRTPLTFAALSVGLVNAGQGINLLRSLPAHIQMNRLNTDDEVQNLNRLSLGNDIAFIVLWIVISVLLGVAAVRAPASDDLGRRWNEATGAQPA
jgi:hypothetical protein